MNQPTTTTTTTTPAVTTPTMNRDLFVQIVGELLSKSFTPEERQDPSGLAYPFNVVTSDERRVWALMSAQLYNADGKGGASLAWRIKHAHECGVIGAPSKLRFLAREVSGEEIQRAEKETREVARQMASNKIALRSAKAAERQADVLETLMKLFFVSQVKNMDVVDLQGAYGKLMEVRAAARADAAKAQTQAKATEATEAKAKATEAKAA